MKLNLLPVTVSRGAKTRSAWVVSILIIAGCAVGCFFIITKGESDLADANKALEEAQPAAMEALAMSNEADTQIQLAAPYLRNITLAKSMIAHNRVYPDLYQKIFRYIPPFFRINSITAVSAGPDTAQVTMQGTLTSHQQYADLMLALLRPGSDVISVSRTGFISNDLVVPPLQTIDQVGQARKPNEAPVPSDPLERLTYFQSQSHAETYSGEGNFGTEGAATRFAKPGDSLITVQLLVKASLQVPNPTATLSSGGAAGATGATGISGAPTGIPGVPGGGGPPSATMPSPGAGGARATGASSKSD